MKKILYHCLVAGMLFTGFTACASEPDSAKKKPADNSAAIETDLKVPKGFIVSLASDTKGRARHIAVTPQGNMYVKLNKLLSGKGILYLTDANGDGRYDTSMAFGNYAGTGIAIKDGYLYASSDEEVFRYKLNDKGEVINPAQPEKIVTGLVNKHQHESKSITLDNDGNIYVNIGAYSNSCQEADRTNGSKGKNPCPILQEAGGIWKFKANTLNQSYANGTHYATGLRNVVGLDWNVQTNSLFVMQHGRDQLDMFPQYYSAKQSADLPAECLYEVKQDDNCGWPYMYYDQQQKKKMLSPEYGGDGKKVYTGKAKDPAIAFPAHLAPNGLLFYTGNMFPDKYKNGAFIAFHGSWNRAPEPQEGFYVVFAPFKDGKPTGEWEVFADGFAGKTPVMSPNQAAHRPCGLAQAPDGSIYVSDDVKGFIYKITYQQQ